MTEQARDPLHSHPVYARLKNEIEQQDWLGAQASLRMLFVSFSWHPELETLDDFVQRQQAQSAATPTTGDVEYNRLRFNRRWVRLLAATTLFLCLGLMIVVGVTHVRYVRPSPTAEPVIDAAQLAEIRQTVRLALSAGDCQQAAQAYQDLLRQAPHDRTIEMELKLCQERMAATQLYAQGIAALQAGDWQAAHQSLETLRDLAPTYPNLDSAWSALERQQTVATGWDQAEAACAARDWTGCLAELDRLQDADLHYRQHEVQDLIAYAAYQLGIARVLESKGNQERIDAAVDDFNRALQYDPNSTEIRLQCEMAIQYGLGTSLFEQRAVQAAISKLAPLYEVAPTYAGGHVAQLLHAAWWQYAALLEFQGDLSAALAAYQAAIAIQGVDSTAAQAGLAQLIARLTPTPLPTATPTATSEVSPTPRPTAKPSPTATPTPLPYQFHSYGATLTADDTCKRLTVQGWVQDDNGSVAGVEVTIWTESWTGPIVVTDSEGYYCYFLDDFPKIGNWFIKLSIGGTQVSDVVRFSTRDQCDSNLVYISWYARY